MTPLSGTQAVTLAFLAAMGLALWGALLAMPMAAVPPGWSAAGVLSTVFMWILMMLAMMIPAMIPMVTIYAGLAEKQDRGLRLAARIGAFFAGYFALWATVSVVLALTQLILRDSAWFTMGGTRAVPMVAGILMLIAGAYQLTGIKDMCLRHCRSPLGFLMQHWREGLGGAFPMGLRHGIYCVGCCIAFMGLMFVFGAMNPLWMAVIAAYFMAEKLLPRAERWGRWVGVALIGAGLAVVGVSQARAGGETAEVTPIEDSLAFCGAKVTALAWFYKGLVAEGGQEQQLNLDSLLHLRTQMRAEAIRRGAADLARFDARSEAQIGELIEQIEVSEDRGALALAQLNIDIRSCVALFFEKEE